MAQDVILPKLGLTMTRGVIVEWFKKQGDLVSSGDDLFTFETDKVVSTVKSEREGVLEEILVEAGEEATVFAVIGRIGDAGTTPVPPPTPVSVMAAPEHALTPAAGRVNASPLARKLAAAHGIELCSITPSGNRVEARDVEAAIAARGNPVQAEPSKREPSIQTENLLPTPPVSLAPGAAVMAADVDLGRLDALCALIREKRGDDMRGALLLRAAQAAAGGDPAFFAITVRDVSRFSVELYIPAVGRLPILTVARSKVLLIFDPERLAEDAAGRYMNALKDLMENPELFLSQ